MKESSEYSESCGPHLRGSNVDRGPTAKDDSAFDMEKKQRDAIAERCGEAVSDKSGMYAVKGGPKGHNW